MERVVLYKDKEGHDEIAIRVTTEECFSWGGYAICDLCNEIGDPFMYLCPELGSKALCQSCFDEHKEHVRFYEEDKKFIVAMLEEFTTSYRLSFSNSSLDTIRAFIKSLG